jgi:hypothetical protein
VKARYVLRNYLRNSQILESNVDDDTEEMPENHFHVPTPIAEVLQVLLL